jgi:hypothetical protein
MAETYQRRVDPRTGGLPSSGLPAVSGLAVGAEALAGALRQTARAGEAHAVQRLRHIDLEGQAHRNRALARLEADGRAKLRELEDGAAPGGGDLEEQFSAWFDERRQAALEGAPKGWDAADLSGDLDKLRLSLGERAAQFVRSARIEHQVTSHQEAHNDRRRIVITDPDDHGAMVEATRRSFATLAVPPIIAERLEREALRDLEGDRIEGLIFRDPGKALADLDRGAAADLDADRRAGLLHKARAAVDALERDRLAAADLLAKREGAAIGVALVDLGLDGPDGGGWVDAYLGQLRKTESGGRIEAASATSSAAGLYQITADTWAGLMKNNPDLGLTEAGRTGTGEAARQQQEAAARALTLEHARALEGRGLPASPANLRVLHVLGADRGRKLVEAARRQPAKPLADLVPADWIAANPGLLEDGQTAGEAYDAIAKGYARTLPDGRGAGLSAILAELRAIPDPVMREAASSAAIAEHGRREKARAEELARLTEQAFAYVEEGGKPAELPPSLWSRLEPSTRKSLEDRSRQVLAGVEPVTDWDAYLALERMGDREIAALTLPEWRPLLSDEHYQRFAKRQADVLAGKATDDPAGLQQQIAAAADRFGLEDESRGLFVDRVYRAVDAEQRRTGASLDYAGRQAVIDQLTTKGVTAPGLLWNSTGQAFEAALGKAPVLRPGDLDAQRREIASATGIDPGELEGVAAILDDVGVAVTTEMLSLAHAARVGGLDVSRDVLVELWAIKHGRPTERVALPKPLPVANPRPGGGELPATMPGLGDWAIP